MFSDLNTRFELLVESIPADVHMAPGTSFSEDIERILLQRSEQVRTLHISDYGIWYRFLPAIETFYQLKSLTLTGDGLYLPRMVSKLKFYPLLSSLKLLLRENACESPSTRQRLHEIIIQTKTIQKLDIEWFRTIASYEMFEPPTIVSMHLHYCQFIELDKLFLSRIPDIRQLTILMGCSPRLSSTAEHINCLKLHGEALEFSFIEHLIMQLSALREFLCNIERGSPRILMPQWYIDGCRCAKMLSQIPNFHLILPIDGKTDNQLYKEFQNEFRQERHVTVSYYHPSRVVIATEKYANKNPDHIVF
ncbi:unnamed protein product [Didymodactylos carnosus]|uniref:Uncharacterized protein n=1 Tax=Didymodactylos carnosus TaxID=1234261 RepID=A0A815ZRN0_9BILA|nr:unnamed protein product [Didymodactylos carnosus]CAF4459159.1 unnamed protein product [Didymodactylos carnosus]